MEKMETLLAMFLAFLLVLGHRLADGCSCMPAHPQGHYCHSDFTIKAMILKREPMSSPGRSSDTHYIYQARIERVFKGDDLKEGMDVEISTAMMESLCGNPNLQDDRKYLLTGRKYRGQLHHGLCNLAIEWRQVSHFQRQGLRNFYKKSCDECEIRVTFGNRYVQQSDRQCAYDPFLVWRGDAEEDCESKYSTCIQKSKGQCNWLTTTAYEKCALERQITAEGSGFL